MVSYAYVAFFEYTAMNACRRDVVSEKKTNRPRITNLQYVSALGSRGRVAKYTNEMVQIT
jgi:hypothetical protein